MTSLSGSTVLVAGFRERNGFPRRWTVLSSYEGGFRSGRGAREAAPILGAGPG